MSLMMKSHCPIRKLPVTMSTGSPSVQRFLESWSGLPLPPPRRVSALLVSAAFLRVSAPLKARLRLPDAPRRSSCPRPAAASCPEGPAAGSSARYASVIPAALPAAPEYLPAPARTADADLPASFRLFPPDFPCPLILTRPLFSARPGCLPPMNAF